MNIGTYDGHAVLSLLQSLSWIALIGAILYILFRLKPLEAKTRQIILLFFATWATASVFVSLITFYQYFDNRNNLKDFISSQKQQEELR